MRSTSAPIEPLVKGIQVIATLPNGSTFYDTTDVNGAYSFSAAQIPATTIVRIEFVNISASPTVNASSFYTATAGGNGSSVQFPTAGTSTNNINYGIINSEDFAGNTNPRFAAPQHIPGNPLGGGTAGSLTSLKSMLYNSSGTIHNSLQNNASASVIGAVWGLAWDKYYKKLFSSAFVRRHSGLGPLGAGGIYVTDFTSGTGTSSSLINVDTVPGIDLGSVPSNATRGLSASATAFNIRDELVFALVGKAGLGDMDISLELKKLYVVNLFEKNIIVIDIANFLENGILPNASDVSEIAIQNMPNCTNGEARPFALKIYRDKLYIGITCTAELDPAGASAANMNMTVVAMDLNSNAWTIPIATTTLNYSHGEPQVGGGTANHPWSDDMSANAGRVNGNGWVTSPANYGAGNAYFCSRTSPYLSDIEFDIDGSMILGITDRGGFQWGGFQPHPNSGTPLTDLMDFRTGGDIRRAYNNNGTFEMEVSGTTSAGGGCGTSSGFAEYYCGENFGGTSHAENSGGALAFLPGSGEIMETAMDPAANIWANGVQKLNNSTGQKSGSGIEFYAGNIGAPGFAKSGGMGDIEILTDVQPIQVGNLVWVDANKNGIQDPGEPSLSGITVTLRSPGTDTIYDNGNDQLWTTLTSTTGNYFFDSTNMVLPDIRKPATWAFMNKGLLQGYDYRLEIDTAAILGMSLALTDAGSNDRIDNDASIVGNKAVIDFNTGVVNHTYDFGFECNFSYSFSFNYTAATCPSVGITANNNASLQILTNGVKVAMSTTGIPSTTYAAANNVVTGSYTYAAQNGAADTFYVRIWSGANCYMDTMVTVTPSRCCPTMNAITTPANFASYCSGAVMPNFNVTTNAIATDSIRLVSFTEPQTNPSTIYNTGNILATRVISGTAATVSNTANFTNVPLPNAVGNVDDTLYIYAIYIDKTGDTTCHVIASKTILLKAQPVAQIAGFSITCNGSSVTLTSDPATTYKWGKMPSAAVLSTAQSYSPTPTASSLNTYWLVTTNATGCASDTAYHAVTASTGIVGSAFRDYNSDGILGTNEIFGYANIKVRLYDHSGNLIDSTTTDTDGRYAFSSVTAGMGKVKIEFDQSTFPPQTQESFSGTNNGTDVQFVTAPNCSVNLGLKDLGDYCQNTPKIATPVYINGATNAVGIAGSLTTWSYANSGTTAGDRTAIADKSEIGSTWGLAYERKNKNIYSATVLKRHVGILDNDNNGFADMGAIYKTNTLTGTTSLFMNIPNAGVLADDAGRGLGLPTVGNTDSLALSKTMKIGLGDIDISADQTKLYVTNLNDKKLYVVDIATASVLNSYQIPDACNAATGESRPFALGVHNGKVYVGAVCDASISQLDNDLQATVYEFDGSTFTTVLSTTLNYNKTSPATSSNPSVTGWYGWSDNYATISTIFGGARRLIHPQPVLSDIDFDSRGNMVLGFIDRTGFQGGFNNLAPLSMPTTGTQEFITINGGEILLATKSPSGMYLVESNPVGASEFYDDNSSVAEHSEGAVGGIAMNKNTFEVISAAMDPSGNTHSGGIFKFNGNTGAKTGNFEVFHDPSGPGQFGKGSGMGDLELLCNEAPLQIGNYVWYDSDHDGVQDPNENPIPNIIVTLWKNGSQIASTTTNTKGEYYFSQKSVLGASWTGTGADTMLLPQTSYEIKIQKNTQAFIDTLSVTSSDVTTNFGNDQTDNDAQMVGNFAVISITTGDAGTINHTFDFGFENPPCQKPDAGADASACASSCINLTAISPSTGTWSSQAGNPTGATLGTTTTGVANVCFSASAVGTYNFIYSILGGCNDTMSVVVSPKPSAGSNLTACGATCVNLTGSAPSNGTWTAMSGNPAGATLGATSSGMAEVCFTPTASGSFNFIYTTAGGCSDTMSVVVNPKPNAGSDITACGATCVNLTGSAPSNGTWTAMSGNPAGATLGATSSGAAEVCFTPTASGSFNFIYTTAEGCSDTMSVVVNPKPNAGSDITACGATCVNLTGSAPSNGTWTAMSGNPAGATLGATSSGTAEVCFTPTASGSFNFIYTTAGGCSDTMSVVVNPKPNAGSDITACGATCVNLTGSAPSNGTWTAMSGNPAGATLGATSSGTAEVCFTPTASGSFNFIYTTAGGCSDTMSVVVNPKPNAGSDITACGATCVNLTGSAPSNGTWTAMSGNPAGATLGATSSGTAEVCFTPTASGSFNFIYTTAGGCSDTMSVDVSPKPNAGSDITACGATCVNLTGSAPSNGTWTAMSGNPAGATLGATSSGTAEVCFTPTASGSFNFIYTTAGGCSDTMSVDVSPKPNAGSDITACGATCVNLTGSAPSNGTWTAMSGNPAGATLGATSSGMAEVCFSPTASGSFNFIYTTAGGCSDTMSVDVTPKPIAGPDQSACYMNGSAVVTLAGSGIGTWSEQPGNPASTTINAINNPTTTINNFSVTGTYNYIWTNNSCTDTVSVVITPNGNVGNYVWNDLNNNGLNDETASEGINGLTVELWKETIPNSNLFVLDQSTTTVNDNSSNPGYYNFMICETANYQVKFPTTSGSLVLTTQTVATGTDGNSDADINSGVSPKFMIDVNGSGIAKDNPTIDAGYHLPTPTLTAYPNNQFCLGTNVKLTAFGAPGATFNWSTPAGFTGTIDNSVSGESTITILNLTASNNGVYTVTQTLGLNTSLPQNMTVDAGIHSVFEYVATTCVSNMGQVTLDVTPNINMEYAMNGGAYQLSNVFTIPSGTAFVASARPIGTSCVTYYTGSCVYCSGASCPVPAKDSMVTSYQTCAINPITIKNYMTNATSVTFTSTGSGTFDNLSCTTSPCTIHYTPSEADRLQGNVIITATTNDPDGSGPCMEAICSKNIILLNGLVEPTITTNSPVCENSPLIISENSIVGNVTWTGANGYTSNHNPDTLASTPASMQGTVIALLSAPGCLSTVAASNINVIAAPNLNVVVTPHDELCSGSGNGSIEVSISGGSGSYQICYNSNLSNCVMGSYANFQYVAPGNYTVTVIDQACPNNVFSYPVTINAGIIVQTPIVPSSISTCTGTDLVLSGTSTGTINWTFAGNTFNALGNTVTRYNAQAFMSGVYMAKTFAANGCASIGVPVLVTVSDAPVIVHVQVNCISNASHIDITATANDPILYSLNGTTYQSSNIFDGTLGGNYTLYVKNSVTNCVTTLPLNIPNCACPTAPIINVIHPLISCGTTAIPLTASWSNAATATWTTTGTGFFSSTTGSSPITNTYTPSAADVANGSVSMTITTSDPDATGPCTPEEKIIIIQLVNNLTTPIITTNQASYCTGDTVMLMANVSTPVHWTGTGGFVSDSIIAYIPNATEFISGPYTVTVEGNGCTSASATYNLVVAPAPNLTVTTNVVNENCEGHGNGEITVNVSGGSGLYKICNAFELNCNMTPSPYTFKYLAPDTYQIHVSDAGCPNARTIIPSTVGAGLHVPPPVSASFNNPVCEGGDLILTAIGNNALPFEWTDKTNSFISQGAVVTRTNAQVGMSGKYKVVQIDNGCASTPVELDVIIYDNPEILAIDTFCAGGDSGRITITANIASGQQIEYALNDGMYQSSNEFEFLSNGLYQVHARSVGSQDCEAIVTGIELYCSCQCNREALVSVYPSPNNGKFTVKAELEVESENIRYEIYDLVGKRIYHEETDEKTHILNHSISIDHLAAGNYILKVTVDLDSFLVPVSITEK